MPKFLPARLQSAAQEYKPHFVTAYITYLDLDKAVAPDVELDPKYTSVLIESGDHPLLAEFAPVWQRKVAGPKLDSGEWYAVAMLDEDRVFGHFWVTLKSSHGNLNGVPNLNLGPDEAFGWDLWLDPAYRRGNIGLWAARVTIETLRDKDVKIGYTHLVHDNAGSVLWHHGIGFNWVQIYNYLQVGPRIQWKVPRSESPMYGPLSETGRHSEEAPTDPFGGQLLPQ